MHVALDHHGDPIEAAVLYQERRDRGEEWWQERKALGFTCPGCTTPVYLVRGALGKNGKSPLFRISHKTPHTSDACKKQPSDEPAGAGHEASASAGPPEPGVRGVGGVKAVRYEDPAPLHPVEGKTGGSRPVSGDSGPGGGRRYVEGGGPPSRQESVSLRSHLKVLRASPDYPGPGMRVYTSERGEMNAQDYFCEFPAAHLLWPEVSRTPRLMAYWGLIETVNRSKNLFLNGKGMALMLTSEPAEAFLAALRITDADELQGCHIIAEGYLSEFSNGSLALKITETATIKRIAVLPPVAPTPVPQPAPAADGAAWSVNRYKPKM